MFDCFKSKESKSKVPAHLKDLVKRARQEVSACSGISDKDYRWDIVEVDPVGHVKGYKTGIRWPVIPYPGRPDFKVVAYTQTGKSHGTTHMAKGIPPEGVLLNLKHEFLHCLVNGRKGIKEWHPKEYAHCAEGWTGDEPQ